MRYLGLLVTVVLLSGCQATHLIYVYDLSVGIDAAYSQEGSARVVFGYDRGTFAIVPQKEPRESREWSTGKQTYEDDDGEIMSLAAVSQVRSRGLNELKFNHFIATGTAAEGVAEDSAGMAQIRAAIFGVLPVAQQGGGTPTPEENE